MPTEIVELDDVLPDDVEFHIRGTTFTLPGDISNRETFRAQKLVNEMAAAEVAWTQADGADDEVEKARAAYERTVLEVEGFLLELARRRGFDAEEIPGGSSAFRYILTTLLVKIGFGQQVQPDPQTPRPNRQQRRSGSRRSSGS